MTTSKLPARPSLESLRKQAKKLARGIVAGDPDAIVRARAQLPQAELPLSQRDAQLVLAREYGFPGWQYLVKEVKQRLGEGREDGAVAGRGATTTGADIGLSAESCPLSVVRGQLRVLSGAEPSQVAGGSSSLNTNWQIGLGVGNRAATCSARGLFPTFH